MIIDRSNIERTNGKAMKRKTAMVIRWLHIYISMASFAIVFFFAVTGLTLNHAEQFGDEMRTVQQKGALKADWVRDFIDLCAVLLVVVSLTGFVLILFMKKKRVGGIAVAVCGLFIAWLVYRIWIK
jgi:hypothetical protein